jgi:hypothetical protein
MRDPIIDEIRRVRAKLSKEMAEDPDKFFARLNDLHHKICDVVVSPSGERRYITSAAKMHEVFIAPRLAKKAAAKKQRLLRGSTRRTD